MRIEHDHLRAFLDECGLSNKAIAEKVSAMLNYPFSPSNLTNYLAGREIPARIQHVLLTVLADIENNGMIWAYFPFEKIERFCVERQPDRVLCTHMGYPMFLADVRFEKGEDGIDTVRLEKVVSLSPDNTEAMIRDRHAITILLAVSKATESYLAANSKL